MTRKLALLGTTLILTAACTYWLFARPGISDLAVPNTAEAVEQGRYLVYAGGCIGCHAGLENKQALSGGLALESDFGTFYVPNITPDATGIIGWGGRDFILALKHGRRPDGGFYFPSFPYRAYSGLTDAEVLSIGAYLLQQPAVESSIPSHQLVSWLSPWMMAGWNLAAEVIQADPPAEPDPVIARGAYLARKLGHCGECHTPRNALGIPDLTREFAGATMGEDVIEAIDAAALADWTTDDVKTLLFMGMLPDGEFVGGEMTRVIDHNTSQLTDADRSALAAFLKRE